MRRAAVRNALVGSLILGACSDKPAPPAAVPPPAATPAASAIETTTFAPALGVDLAASTKAPSGLYYRDLVAGTGAVVANGQMLSMRYTGWLPDGTRFDGNEQGGDPLTFALGAKAVIDGWDQGIAGMRVGGKRQLIIPSALGYGPNGNGPIPPNAVMVFNVEVLSAQ
jgi:FKBP-type peptidyl-prolyl cis-trans isomerase